MCLNGLTSLMPCSQPGARLIGSRIPDSSRTGIMTTLMTGAITSSLFVVSASAFEAAAQAAPISSVSSTPSSSTPSDASMPSA